ncbi:hypothetical protein SAMN05421813_1313 [Daejeonella rubra]|uniref:Uncharacterized protein n=1 Tax=Daejeonella rubra TaxID=990371 RepID=A0A1G9XJX8_9SPHI|nr:hypothetical protein SAMN05421813_1313 [Daejeonella rubra]
MAFISLFPQLGQSINNGVSLVSIIFNSFFLNWNQLFTPKSQIGHFLFLVPTNFRQFGHEANSMAGFFARHSIFVVPIYNSSLYLHSGQ